MQRFLKAFSLSASEFFKCLNGFQAHESIFCFVCEEAKLLGVIYSIIPLIYNCVPLYSLKPQSDILFLWVLNSIRMFALASPHIYRLAQLLDHFSVGMFDCLIAVQFRFI